MGFTTYAVVSVHLMLLAETLGSRSGLARAMGEAARRRTRLRRVLDNILMIVVGGIIKPS